ncbi:MAG: hypothetical protein K2O94_06325 [Clostridiales bacterium]|nr:hypothetical protein [Clostridiales bacterium]
MKPDDLKELLQTVANKAVKEFAEKLKSHKHLMGHVDGDEAYVWFKSELDELVKEYEK